MNLKSKTILVISPQAWGPMFISKHHYALELAKKGNTVFFLNPPNQGKGKKSFIRVETSGVDKNLFLVYHQLWFPFSLKFHALPLFHRLMKFHIKSLLKKIGKPIDIVWSFDIGNLCPLNYFGKSTLKIFHPVDEPLTLPAIDAAIGSDIIFSVTNEILQKYHAFKIPKYFINHGVSEKFLSLPNSDYTPSSPLRIGISGNFLRGDIDRNTLISIIGENPEVRFDCWGSYLPGQTNIGGNEDTGTLEFCGQLQQFPNVKLYGAVTSDKLADELKNEDGFLICYDINKDQSKGTNYHKIMEYLATGKVIISNNVTTYKDKEDLLEMTTDRSNNEELPGLFTKVVKQIQEYNKYELRKKRFDFAVSNTYEKQILVIENLLSNIGTTTRGKETVV